MKFKAITMRGYAPVKTAIVWQRPAVSYLIAEDVCPIRLGDAAEPRRLEIICLLEQAPAMRDLLTQIAFPRRGTKEELFTLQDFADKAAELLAKIPTQP